MDTYCTRLLTIVIRLYFESPSTFIKDNFAGLKAALTCWVISDNNWDVEVFNKTHFYFTEASELTFTYRQFETVQELSFQICRFIDFGCMYLHYWIPGVTENQSTWNNTTRIHKELVTYLILKYLHTFIHTLQERNI